MAKLQLPVCCALAAFILSGSLTQITAKMSLVSTGKDSHGREQHFNKPWFLVFEMFLAMSVALLCTLWKRTCFAPASSGRKGGSGEQPQKTQKAAEGKGSGKAYSTKTALVALPACFDLTATGVQTIGLFFIPTSVSVLLGWAEIFFTATLSVLCLGRKLHGYQVLGLLMCIVGIILVGISTVLGSMDETLLRADRDPADVLFGMALCLTGSVINGGHMVAEEWLLKDLDLSAMEVCGYEGLWGVFLVSAIVFPVVNHISGDDDGQFENDWQAMQMVSHDLTMRSMQMIFMVACFAYNVSGIILTGQLSSVHRVMLNALRVIVIWLFGLFVHYAVDEDAAYAEEWTAYSFLELSGFVLLLAAQVVYGAFVKVPGFHYPPSVESEDVESCEKPASAVEDVLGKQPHLQVQVRMHLEGQIMASTPGVEDADAAVTAASRTSR
eukprot:TRINITY_DN21602_c0_g2_i1.p1 TRINITY_DN21602_c0_g2~~TRINITY_DN21602_c0_g2_i1.p1  ORF type:complete len:440 (-),score=77.17 TRINITY_DN21602_c0_g2_i1:754-2073(-)